VVSYSEDLVRQYVTSLYDRGFVSSITARDRRVVRYDQRLSKLLHCSEQETAILCVLFLRGPQTPGEIKGRTGRLYHFASLDEVIETLETMMNREAFTLIDRLPRLPGRKEHRFAHRFSDDEHLPEDQIVDAEPLQARKAEPDLREEIELLKKQLHDLGSEFLAFKDQF